MSTNTVAALKERESLRLCTAGSVDDGKSTFVGRLLYDTKSVLADQVESMERSSADRGFDGMDLSLLVDGLRAEREQGITIDVAYRYFATDKRTFILADTPGHVQYTRNTVTGISTSQVVVLLVDARHGVVEQTRRHLNVAALLGVRHVILAVNKIDLVDFDEQVFSSIAEEFHSVAERLGITESVVVPISALRGDNVVEKSASMPWYSGPTILEVLESTPVVGGRDEALDFRFPIQYVIREHATDYRGYAGRVKAGVLNVGEEITAPQGRTTTVTHIDTTDGEQPRAVAGDSVVLRLADDIDLARGNLLAGSDRPGAVREFASTVVVLTDKALVPGQMLQLRYGTSLIKARVETIERILDLDGLVDEIDPGQAGLNDIAHVKIQTAQELEIEDYSARGAVGNFLLIDPNTGNTLAAGFVGRRLR
ncbi:sulfate adenylyltransferase subunit 1 [Corynebacterium flavescens]|uniref:sulfate adenylyltransferase subunit 1 n=1 Tax=Corynebacterium flavescens TaxID=28028 RepID=UPI003FD15C99